MRESLHLSGQLDQQCRRRDASAAEHAHRVVAAGGGCCSGLTGSLVEAHDRSPLYQTASYRSGTPSWLGETDRLGSADTPRRGTIPWGLVLLLLLLLRVLLLLVRLAIDPLDRGSGVQEPGAGHRDPGGDRGDEPPFDSQVLDRDGQQADWVPMTAAPAKANSEPGTAPCTYRLTSTAIRARAAAEPTTRNHPCSDALGSPWLGDAARMAPDRPAAATNAPIHVCLPIGTWCQQADSGTAKMRETTIACTTDRGPNARPGTGTPGREKREADAGQPTTWACGPG